MTRHNPIPIYLIPAVIAVLTAAFASPAIAQYQGERPYYYPYTYDPTAPVRQAYVNVKAADHAVTATVDSLTAAWYNSDPIVNLRAAARGAKNQADAIDAGIKASLPNTPAYRQAAYNAVLLQAQLDALRATGCRCRGETVRLSQAILAAQSARDDLVLAADRANPEWAAADAAYQKAQSSLEAEQKIFAQEVRRNPAYLAAQSAYDYAVARDSQIDADYSQFLADRVAAAVARAKAADLAAYDAQFE